MAEEDKKTKKAKKQKEVAKLKRWDDFKTTEDIYVPQILANQIIGQDDAVDIIKKAAAQRRNVLLIGEPGTGKSLLGQAMAELLPMKEMQDVLVVPNAEDENNPRVKVVKAGQGKNVIRKANSMSGGKSSKYFMFFFSFILLLYPWILYWLTDIDAVIIAAQMIVSILLVSIMVLASKLVKTETKSRPKLLINNADTKKPPFIEATGAHAGALLGDVKHDPLQTFWGDCCMFLTSREEGRHIRIKDLVEHYFEKYPNLIDNAEEGYESVVLPDDEELYVDGMIDGEIKPVRILGFNRKDYSGEMRSVGQDRLLVTPEHKIFADFEFREADKLNGHEELYYHERPILTKEDIIKTYFIEDRVSAYKYYEYLKLTADNPTFGYKRLAKLLNQPEGRVRWWHNGKHKPHAVRTIEYLEERGLLPLMPSMEKISLAARILGALFGEGGIFATLNAVFLSSGEKSSLNAFKEDLVNLFGNNICPNFDLRTGGVNRSSQALWNTNRNVVRFFMALGAPVGKKEQELSIPSWIYTNEAAKLEFFGAFFGSELCSPKFTSFLNTLDIPIAGSYKLRENRIRFLKQVEAFLNSYGIRCTSIYENEFREGRYLWRLLIAKDYENFLRFKQLIPIRYSEAKKERIAKAAEQMSESKIMKFRNMMNSGFSFRQISSALRVPLSKFQLLADGGDVKFPTKRIEYTGKIYNITTESGNLFVNNTLAANSGGLGTPPHQRVLPGLIHKASKGVLFVDEIGTMDLKVQHDLLTAMQNREMHITGRSEMSSGAMVVTEPVPCDFVLVAAGNAEVLPKLHPALRSRIQGYGYEVYMNDSVPDSDAERRKLVQFVAQEITKDKKIPHFEKDAIHEMLLESKRRAGRKGRLTLRLRELGGLVRAAGDLAVEKKHKYVTRADVKEALKASRTLEAQAADKYVERRKEYEVIKTSGFEVGRVNGLAVIGNGGIVLPIVSEVTDAESRDEGRTIVTGRLGDIAKEAVHNVSAIVKKYVGKNIRDYDVHVQFLQTYEGVEGDSASVSVAVAALSALENIPVKQGIAMTGSINVRGEVLPVGGITPKVEAAIYAGLKEVIVPKSNKGDLILDPIKAKKIKVIYAETIKDVLKNALAKGNKKILKKF
jgi:Lon-like ATP-dependent protease